MSSLYSLVIYNGKDNHPGPAANPGPAFFPPRSIPVRPIGKIVNRLLNLACDQESLSEKNLLKIDEGIRDIRQGKTRTLDEIAGKLGS
jgi:hypothetical protein